MFLRPVAPGDLAIEILGNRQTSLLCYGLTALDDETLQYLAAHPAVLSEIYVRGAAPFAVFADSVRVQGGRMAPPGGTEAIPLWEAVVGERVTRPDRFLVALFTQADGWMAHLYDTIGQLDRGRQRFALGLWINDSPARLDMMHALAGAAMAVSGDRSDMKTQPFVRRSYDLAALLMRVRVDAAGGPLAPSSRGFWARVVEGAELPAEPARILREAADDRPIDAAWLAGLVGTGDMRLRAEHLDQFAFGQRVFAAASPAEMPDVFVAVRAFRRYRMLMVTLERIGISKPATYAAAARLGGPIWERPTAGARRALAGRPRTRAALNPADRAR